MNHVKWVGTPGGRVGGRAHSKPVNRWMVGTPVQRTKAPPMGADYWLGVIGIFLACFILMAWAAIAAA